MNPASTPTTLPKVLFVTPAIPSYIPEIIHRIKDVANCTTLIIRDGGRSYGIEPCGSYEPRHIPLELVENADLIVFFFIAPNGPQCDAQIVFILHRVLTRKPLIFLSNIHMRFCPALGLLHTSLGKWPDVVKPSIWAEDAAFKVEPLIREYLAALPSPLTV